MRRTNPVFLIAMLLVLGTSTLKADLVTDGGFETGSLAGWTSSVDWVPVPSLPGIINGPHSGSYFAATSCIGRFCTSYPTAPTSFLSQTLATTIGQTYTLTFFLDTGIDPKGRNTIDNALLVTWGGTLAWAGQSGSFAFDDGWLGQVIVNGLVATSTSTVLQFSGRQDDSFLGVDDIHVNASAATVPEPSTIATVGSFLVGLVIFARRSVLIDAAGRHRPGAINSAR